MNKAHLYQVISSFAADNEVVLVLIQGLWFLDDGEGIICHRLWATDSYWR